MSRAVLTFPMAASASRFAIDDLTLDLTAPVPVAEPATVLLLGAGLVGAAGVRRGGDGHRGMG